MAQMPAANASRFNFTAQSGDFGVYAFSSFEEVCKPYEFGIELVSRPANVDHRQDHLSRSLSRKVAADGLSAASNRESYTNLKK